MKKILFNGCSFVAGDAIVWKEFLSLREQPFEEHNGYLQRVPQTAKRVELFLEYNESYRKSRNIPSITAKILNTTVLDISKDGNSNENIVLSTIFSLLNMSKEEREKYHVVIGWTEPARRLKYVDKLKEFRNLSPGLFTQGNKFSLSYLNDIDSIEFVKHAIINVNELDHFRNYIECIMNLENFLRANNVSYTFYRNIGDKLDYDVTRFICSRLMINTALSNTPWQMENSITCHENWWMLDDKDSYVPAYRGQSVFRKMGEKYEDTSQQWAHPISNQNQHPDLNTGFYISNCIAEKIKNSIIFV